MSSPPVENPASDTSKFPGRTVIEGLLGCPSLRNLATRQVGSAAAVSCNFQADLSPVRRKAHLMGSVGARVLPGCYSAQICVIRPFGTTILASGGAFPGQLVAEDLWRLSPCLCRAQGSFATGFAHSRPRDLAALKTPLLFPEPFSDAAS